MNCSEIAQKLGTHLDGELPARDAETVRAHLAECEECTAQFRKLQTMVEPLRASREVRAPAELWGAIEAKLDAEKAATISLSGVGADTDSSSGNVVTTISGGSTPHRRMRPFLVAAAVLLPIGMVALFLQLSTPQPALAEEAVIDFRPLLAGIENNYEAAMADFLAHHKGRPMTLAEAGKHLHVRVHPKDPMPDSLVLKQTHLLTLGKKRGLLFQFAGPQGRLVISQCPVGVKKEHGDHHCLPCKIGARPEAEAVHVGSWRLVHLPSEKGCICVLSTIDADDDLAKILESLQIEF